MRGIGPIALLALLAGCATPAMTEKECLAGDWYGAGLEDGVAGLRETNFDARAAACYEHDASADLGAYREGRAEGLFRFCTSGGGYEYGRAGKSYLGVCLAEDEPGFLGAYLEGWRVRRAEEERRRAASAYDSALYAIEGYRDDIRRARRVLSDKEATEKEIKKARSRLDHARDNLPYAEQRADALLYELGRADEALERTIGSLEAWRRSREFSDARAILLEAQDFARGEEAVDFCTDDASDGFNRPECEIRPGAAVNDRSGERVCASGPAKAVMARRGDAYGPYAEAEIIQVYQIFNRDEQGRTARRPDSQFVALFDGAGAYLGAMCAPFETAP